jgi:RsiW-degrading membrane proteinase PrsW (M82 family)
MPLFSGEAVTGEAVSWWMRAAGAFLGGLLFVPSMGLALLRIMDRPIPAWTEPALWKQAPKDERPGWRKWILIALVVLWLSSLAAGQLVIDATNLDWLLLPPLYLMATVLPIWGLVRLGTGGLRPAAGRRSLQREWGIFSTSLITGPGLAFVLEMAVILLVVIGLILVIASSPPLQESLQRTLQRMTAAQDNREAMMRILRPYLARPSTIFLILGMVSGLIPLLEELVKPLLVWLFARRLEPAEGFAAGILCGAAFALYESLNMVSLAPGIPWIEVAVSRVGTDILHITTSGLVGYAIASTGRDGRYLRLAGIYLLAVALHGVWNLFSMLAGISSWLDLPVDGLLGVLQGPVFSPLLLGLMTAVLLVLLIFVNRRLRPRHLSGLQPADTVLPG